MAVTKKGSATTLKEDNSGLNAKPVVSVIASLTVPPSKIISHAGTIIAFGTGQAKEKITALPSVRAAIRMNLAHLASILYYYLKNRKIFPSAPRLAPRTNINKTACIFALIVKSSSRLSRVLGLQFESH